ncbi:FMN reductase [Acinetobacter genomosp. 15BJ]|uniref:FMN reductase n=1 Tax=Acinetobacter genomosp. 15BJ TaxID=106651 RepID=R9AVX4_9GAMM|nr:FMN reductase [Acinetobacter genomosp. 15BJ]
MTVFYLLLLELYQFCNGHQPAKGLREQKVKAKSEKANQDLSINKQVEQDSILPSVEVLDLDVAEARLHHKKTVAV